MRDVLAFESALLAASLRGEVRQVSFEMDPSLVLEALAQGRLPTFERRSPITLTIGATDTELRARVDQTSAHEESVEPR